MLNTFIDMNKQINIYSVPELRQTIEESLPSIFSTLGYTQNWKLIDTKLAISYLITAVAAVSFLLDKKFKWDQVITHQIYLVGAYMILSILYWCFTNFIEKGIVYQGTLSKEKSNKTITVKIYCEKHSPIFKIILIDSSEKELELKLSATKIFNEYGYFQQHLLLKWFREQLEILGGSKN